MKFAKNTFLKSFFLAFAFGEVAFVVSIQSQTPTPTPEGRVTQIYNDVQLLPAQAQARVAALNDKVGEDTGLKTGENSRSELTFADLTITRLGANTVFSFNRAGRSVRLDSGAILLYVKKNSGGAEISTKAVSVGITGTTLIFDSSAANGDDLVVLEGSARMTLKSYPEQSAFVQGGQMLRVPSGAAKMPTPINVRIEDFLKSYPLLADFPPLPSQDLMMAVVQGQNAPLLPSPSPEPSSRTAKKPQSEPSGSSTHAPLATQSGPGVWTRYRSGTVVNPTPPPPRTGHTGPGHVSQPQGGYVPRKPTPTPTPKKKRRPRQGYVG
jgi:hypothetical protein